MKHAPLVLVTGATGFVGQHLCASLHRAGWRVRATRVHSAPPSSLSSLPIDWQTTPSIDSKIDWRPHLEGVEAVVHLAAIAHRLGKEALRESAYEQANHQGTARLAEQASTQPGIRRFLFVSSIGAVASLSDIALSEESPCNPDTSYGRSKLAAELAVQRILTAAGVPWCILRPPLLYGPGNPGNMERLLRLIRLPIPLPFRSIRNRRNFLFVGNFVDAILRALDHPGAANRLFCVADAEELSTPELMRRLGRVSNRRVRLVPFPVAALKAVGRLGSFVGRLRGRPVGFDLGTVEKFCGSLPVDGSRFCQSCDWQPPFSIDDGLRATVAEDVPPLP